MIGPYRVTLALGASFGSPVTLLAFAPWHSVNFDGIKMVIEADLPSDVEDREIDLPGFLVVDVAHVAPTRAELLLIRN